MEAADNFDFAFFYDAHPEPRRGFVIKVFTSFVGMGRAARNNRDEIRGWNAHGLSEGRQMRSGVRIIFTCNWIQFSQAVFIPIMLPINRPTATASVVLTTPGTRKEWLITYLPIRVVPERSKLIAAMIVP